MKDLKFVQSHSVDQYFLFQTQVMLHNFRKYNYSDKSINLIFVPQGRENDKVLDKWKMLEEQFPEATFAYIHDDGTVMKDIAECNYIPLIRPYCLREYFKLHPELSECAIFYHDADILLTKVIDFDSLLQDDICYLSYTGSRFGGGNYINVNYLDSKLAQCKGELTSTLMKENVIETLASFCGITEEIIRKNNEGTGGAQTLLKGIDAQFWDDVYNSCKLMRPYFSTINQTYFPGNTANEKENNGFQGFCSDMWSLLYNLWRRNIKTETPECLDFAWATDPIKKLEEVSILHNAGVTSHIMKMGEVSEIFFFKGQYHTGKTSPFQDRQFLQMVTPSYCTKYYADSLLEIPNPII